MRRSIKTGASFAAFTLAIEALAVLPGRIAVGREQSLLGRSPIEYVIAGTLRDLSDLALPIGLVVLCALAGTLFVRSAPRDDGVPRRTAQIIVGLLASLALLLWLTSSTAAEFKIQRGVDVTLFDVENAKNSTGALGQFIGFLLLRRHWVATITMLGNVALVLAILYRRSQRWSVTERAAVVIAFVATTAAGYGAALVPLDPNVRVFRTIADRNVVGAPFVTLFGSFDRSKKNVRLGMKVLLEDAQFPEERSRGGEALLGLPTSRSRAVDCAIHPMARALPVRGVEAPLAGALGHHDLAPEAARVLTLLDAISADIYDGRTTPVDVWQVMLESFRADDIHAISPAAPRELAPFMSSLYEAASTQLGSGEGSVIAVHRMWQAGSRTSQGLSAYLCGLGMMPYGLSITRDFGPLPVRCIPGVLLDAGFDPAFFYGGNPSFDEMDTFLRQQGVRGIVGRLQQPASSPTSEGGVSDRALYAHAVEAAATHATERARYMLLMSSSNHVPYRRPDDLPDEIARRVDELEKTPGYAGGSDDTARLRTFAYADLALSELVHHPHMQLDRSIFVFGADHSTTDPLLWPVPTRNLQASHALIPFVMVLPAPLVERSAHPDHLRQLVRELDAALDGHAWSQNDVPLFVLTLLSHSPQIRDMPDDARWHTLGGERTSPFFAAPRATEAQVIGIDCNAGFYGVDDADAPRLPPETAAFVQSPKEIYSVSPTLMPVSAFLSRFLVGYGAKCRTVTPRRGAPW
jgi:hypothetical protein